MGIKTRRIGIGIFVLIMLVMAVQAGADVRTWDGGGSDTEWATADNWNPDGYSDSDDLTVLSGSPTSTVNVIADNGGTITLDGSAAVANFTWDTYIGNTTGESRLNILNGANLTNGYGRLGFYGGTSGIATVSGTGSTWTNNEDIYAGGGWSDTGGTGELIITDGGSVSCAYCHMGYSSGSLGKITVSGAESELTYSYKLYVGRTGTGELSITDGGIVAISNGTDCYLGYSSGSSGKVTISGTGSKWGGGPLHVGRAGTGELTITNGGSLSTHGLYLGQDGSSGSATWDITSTDVDITISDIDDSQTSMFCLSGSYEINISATEGAPGETVLIKMVSSSHGNTFRGTGGKDAQVAGLNNITMQFEGTYRFSAGLGPNTYEVAGKDLGAEVEGLTNNFALEGLTLSGTGGDVTYLMLLDESDNMLAESIGAEALYVENLIVSESSILDVAGLNLYYLNGTIDGTVIDSIGTGGVYQIPEPATLALLTIGGLGILLRRRRSSGRTKTKNHTGTSRICLIGLMIMVTGAGIAFADETYWQLDPPATGDWFEETNWTNGVPNGTVDAKISNGGTALISGDDAQASVLMLGVTDAGNISHTGGTNTVGGAIFVGFTSSGLYDLSGSGHLSCPEQYIGILSTGLFNHSGGINNVTSLYIGYMSGSTGNYQLSGTGSLLAEHEYVGYNDVGTFTQTGGTNTVTGDLKLANSSDSKGTYTLSGGTLNVGGSIRGGSGDSKLVLDGGVLNISGAISNICNFTVGKDSTASYTQTGGTNTVNNDLSLGYNAGSNGTYNLSGGTLSVQGMSYIGHSGAGSIAQTGGSKTVGADLYLGKNTDSSGTYNLSGNGSLSVEGETYIGHSGTGSMTQTGGANTVNGTMYLGYDAGASGRYEISGGSLYNQRMYVGYDGTGYALQTGGTNTVDGSVFIGCNAGSEGTYEIRGGRLDIESTIGVGRYGNGTFIHSGGNISAGWTSIGYWSDATGTYELSGNGVLIHEGMSLGGYGTGIFRQSGGVHVITEKLCMPQNGSGAVTYELSGGFFTCPWESLGNEGAAVATFLQSGGINLAGYLSISELSRYEMTGGLLRLQNGAKILGEMDFTNSDVTLEQTGGILDLASGNVVNTSGVTFRGLGMMSLLILPAGFDPETDFRNYSNTALTHYSGGTLVVPADKGFKGVGTVIGHIHNEGVIEMICNDAWPRKIDITGGLKVTNDGKALLGDGTLAIENEISGMDSGRISNHYTYVGMDGTGRFVQTGGSVAAYQEFTLGVNPGSHGTYEFAGGYIYSPIRINIGQGGTGVFLHSAGGISSTYCLVVAQGEGSNGTYELSGTSELSARYQHVGLSGTGRFVQTGGTNNPRELTIGSNTGSDGTYELIDGALIANNQHIANGGTGRFIQTGGTNEGSVSLGDDDDGDGTYELRGGTFTGSMTIGYEGTGRFIQTGGTSNVGTFCIAYDYGSAGTCTFSGGTVNADYLLVGCNNGNGSLEITDAATDITVSKILKFGTKSEFYAVPGATIHMTGSKFQNYSPRPYKVIGLDNLTLIFEGGSEDIDPFEVAGLDLGAIMEGFDSNFALGTLQLGGDDIGYIQLVDDCDNTPDHEGADALYVYNLIIEAGSTLDLNGLNLYYLTATIDGDIIDSAGSGGSQQIPEPASTTILLLGAIAVFRRRKK